MPLPLDHARSMSLQQLLGATAAAHGQRRVTGLALDSRRLQPGDLFFALPGAACDGRNFLPMAVAAGAAAIVAERGLNDLQRAAAAAVPLFEVDALAANLGALAARFYGDPSRQMYLAGVTGTNGKTTVAQLLAQLLRGFYGQCGVIGTLGASIDDSKQDDSGAAEVLNTTPDALALQRQLAEWQLSHAVLEASSHGLLQGRLNGLSFDSALFTNLSRDHLDYHGDMARYGAAKALLFQGRLLAAAIVNADDPMAASLLRQVRPQATRLSYSIAGRKAALQASDIRHHAAGLSARIATPWGSGDVHSPLPGDFNLSNVLAVIAAACHAGMPLTEVLARLPHLQAVTGRMQQLPNERGLQLVIDYAHTPEALRQALRALRAHSDGRLICVFGCGGERDSGKRPLMGAVASAHADRVIVTSDNPRGESPEAIISEIVAGADGPVEVEVDRARAIARAVAAARPGDCILVAGKGHESSQLTGSERLPFSDAGQLRAALAQAGGQ